MELFTALSSVTSNCDCHLAHLVEWGLCQNCKQLYEGKLANLIEFFLVRTNLVWKGSSRGGEDDTPAETERHGAAKWSIFSPAWGMLSDWAISGGFPICVIETEEVRAGTGACFRIRVYL